MEFQLHEIDIVIIAGYLVAIIALGWYLSKRASKNLDSYFLAGKSLPWYVIGTSHGASGFDITGTMWFVAMLFTYGLKAAFIPLLERRSVLTLFLIGLVNGLLPCGLVYVALAGATATGNELSAFLFMVGFGAGTFPVMLGMSLLGGAISGGVRKKLSAAVPVLTFVLGVLLILRGLGLGIPFVSPDLSRGGHTTSHETHH